MFPAAGVGVGVGVGADVGAGVGVGVGAPPAIVVTPGVDPEAPPQAASANNESKAAYLPDERRARESMPKNMDAMT